MRPQPMITVRDVAASSRWYQALLGGASGHGGDEYERILVGGDLVLQLHALDEAHHHGSLADGAVPLGNGLALWFETDDFDAAVERSRDLDAEVVTDAHVNPRSGLRELWLHDLDGYLVVVASTDV